MSQDKPEEQAPDPVAELLEKLTPEQQDDLRRRLNLNAWARRFKNVHAIVEGDKQESDPATRDSLGRKFASAVQDFIDQLESGDLDQVSVQGLRQGWIELLHSIRSRPDASDSVKSQNMESLLEGSYTELQNQLIQVRQAVAQAIATEKQLEHQLTKNRD